jgi:hypothetical protein
MLHGFNSNPVRRHSWSTNARRGRGEVAARDRGTCSEQLRSAVADLAAGTEGQPASDEALVNEGRSLPSGRVGALVEILETSGETEEPETG